MIDELVEILLHPLLERVPDVVWGVLLLLAGGASVVTGAFVLRESVQLGAALVGGGVLAVGCGVVAWRR